MTAPPVGDARTIPTYDELPLLPRLELPHSWGVFGAGDELGTLNFMDDSTVLAALQEARTGERVSVTLDLTAIDPPLYGREPLQHTLIQSDRNIWDDRIDGFYPQGSSQWDGLRHIRCREFGFYGGVTDDPPTMGRRLGIQHWAQRGIIGRGVLLDVGRYLTETRADFDPLTEVSVDADVLQEVAFKQGVQVRRGDVLCLRFGWGARYRSLDEPARRAYAAIAGSPPFAGLSAAASSARLLWNWQIAAVACDNPGAEVSPGNPAVGSLHRRLLPALGMVVGELFDFDGLADRCAADQRWSFLLASIPLNLPGGVGSPSNAVVIR